MYFYLDHTSSSSNLYLLKPYLLPREISFMVSSMLLIFIPPIFRNCFLLQYIIIVYGEDYTPTWASNADWDPFFEIKKLIGFFKYLAASYPSL